MRTTTLKIEGIKKEAVLTCGYSGFKVYVVESSLVVVKGKKVLAVVTESHSQYRVVSRFVMLNYNPASEQETIKAEFKSYLSNL